MTLDPLTRAREALDDLRKASSNALALAAYLDTRAALDELEKSVLRFQQELVSRNQQLDARIRDLEAQLAAQPKPEGAIELSLRLLTELHDLAQWPNNPGKQAARRAQMIERLSEGVIPVPAPTKGESDG